MQRPERSLVVQQIFRPVAGTELAQRPLVSVIKNLQILLHRTADRLHSELRLEHQIRSAVRHQHRTDREVGDNGLSAHILAPEPVDQLGGLPQIDVRAVRPPPSAERRIQLHKNRKHDQAHQKDSETAGRSAPLRIPGPQRMQHRLRRKRQRQRQKHDHKLMIADNIHKSDQEPQQKQIRQRRPRQIPQQSRPHRREQTARQQHQKQDRKGDRSVIPDLTEQ